jgi:4-amino-4-deoxy-L-arabinose transferase-like glycosyltransferase
VTAPAPAPWWKDRSLLWAAAVGLVLRTLPMLVWLDWRCVRDECTYIKMSYAIAEGQGIEPVAGWLWAPAYPTLMALHKVVFGWSATIKGMQVAAAILTVFLLYRLTERHFGPKAARIAAWLFAANPVMAFYAMSLWSEALYTPLLLGMVLAFDHARAHFADEGGRKAMQWAAEAGGLLGLCVLFRGVATYMLPVLAFALLWRRFRARRAWTQAMACCLAAVVVVAPYSLYISQKMGALVIADRTLGQMMWLGNNEFPPIGFDYGNGQLSKRAFDRMAEDGRDRCASKRQAMERDTCETERGLLWMKAHPVEFVQRIPVRLAQMLTPHSLLTRHLRWGYWKGLPQWVDEVIVVVGAAQAMLVMWVGSAGLVARGRDGRGLLVGGLLAYHLLAVAMLAGISRYRIPLEPLLMIYAGALLADPRAAWAALRAQPWRLALLVLVLGALVPLVLWHLPAGWPGWRRW